MRQVPQYLLIGSGVVAQHFSHYFNLLKISHLSWNRTDTITKLHRHLSIATHILLLIKDDAIEDFICTYLPSTNSKIIHCSASLVTSLAYGVHPLMTFNRSLYCLEQYKEICFVVDHESPQFDILFPGLPNKAFYLHKSLKAKYHALCVLAGNFSCMLWQKLFYEFEYTLKLPISIALPFLQQITQNLITDPKKALTGPLVRGDTKTIQKNIQALSADPYQLIYESFICCYKNLQEGER